MNKDKYSEELSIRLMPKELVEGDEEYLGGKVVGGSIAVVEEYEVGEAPDQTEEIKRRYGDRLVRIEPAPTTILSSAIEQVEQMGNYKVMMALVDLDDTKPKDERLYTFCDIESKKLREVIYNEMEKEFE